MESSQNWRQADQMGAIAAIGTITLAKPGLRSTSDGQYIGAFESTLNLRLKAQT